MWNRTLLSLVAVVVAGPAVADTFSGFVASDYLVDDERLCKPLPAKQQGVPSCQRLDPAARAKLKVDQVQATSEIRAEAGGSQLTIVERSGRELRRWASIDPISRVHRVYLSEDAGVVAVEYEARRLGRPVLQVVAFHIAPAKPKPAVPPVASAGGLPAIDFGQIHERPAADRKTLQRVRDELGRKRYHKALALLDASSAKNDPAVSYYRAAALAGVARKGEAIAALENVQASNHRERDFWLVEARWDSAFDALRRDPVFRRVIGVDAKASSAYVKAMEYRGRWEDPGAPCGAPQVKLGLERDFEGKPFEFSLAIVSRCQGQRETTKLGGQWKAIGDGNLSLVFPNPGGDDEVLSCQFAACSGGEQCLECGAGTDFGFMLRPSRR